MHGLMREGRRKPVLYSTLLTLIDDGVAAAAEGQVMSRLNIEAGQAEVAGVGLDVDVLAGDSFEHGPGFNLGEGKCCFTRPDPVARPRRPLFEHGLFTVLKSGLQAIC